MTPSTQYAIELGHALSDCHWRREDLLSAAQPVLPAAIAPALIERLIDELLAGHHQPYAPSPRRLHWMIRKSSAYRPLWRAIKRLGLPPDRNLPPSMLFPSRFLPPARFAELALPQLHTLKDLADWLGLTASELDWFAGWSWHQTPSAQPRFQHYYYRLEPKRAGGVRLIEAPKKRLKAIQRQILAEILDPVPKHAAAHGFAKGRSPLTSAQLHAGEQVVVRFDLTDFFPSIRAQRVHGLFRTLGYPWNVANSLTGLTTARTPDSVQQEMRAMLKAQQPKPSMLARVYSLFAGRRQTEFQQVRHYAAPHLPQGAPSSPALANLAAYRLDCRLSGLARKRDAAYSRYADDLAFSGDKAFMRGRDHFLKLVETIITQEGYSLNHEKTRVMGQGTRQALTGITVNQHLNLKRADYDRLKAILHNCIHQGPSSQNRDRHTDFRAHLEGRINWVEQLNPHRGLKLRLMFDRIDWKQ